MNIRYNTSRPKACHPLLRYECSLFTRFYREYLVFRLFILSHVCGIQHIASTDPTAYPVIDPHICEEPYGACMTFRLMLHLTFRSDLQTMVESVKFNRKLLQTDPLASIISGELCM